MTIVLLGAGVVPAAGRVVPAGSHWIAHFVSFAIVAFIWKFGLPKVSVFSLALAVVAFGFAHEAIEIVGHAHPYEWSDAVVDAIGAVVGVLLGYFANELF